MKELKPLLDEIRKNYNVLDSVEIERFKDVRLISHEKFTSVPEVQVQYIPPWRWTEIFKHLKMDFFITFFYAIRLYFSADKNTVMIINGSGSLLWFFLGFLNWAWFFDKRKMLLWDIFLEFNLKNKHDDRFAKLAIRIKEKLSQIALSGFARIITWSRKQAHSHAEHFDLPEDKFVFFPFKSDHSQPHLQRYNINIGNYIFSGGNSKRDYRTLVDAVSGADIPVIISTTDPEIKKTIKPAPNIIVLEAREPAFAQLQAGSRFIVIPTQYSKLKGTAEANFCNGMFHKKAVIACCSIGAEDYIVDGETGYVLPSGDVDGLREKIFQLWNDPTLAKEMGEKGYAHVMKNFTHVHLMRRLLYLALIIGHWRHLD